MSDERKNELALRAGQIRIDPTPWLDGNGVADRIAVLRDAIETHRLVRFVYRDGRGRKSERRIEPYRLLLKEHDWHVQGFCLARRVHRTFKLLRIDEIAPFEISFEPRAEPCDIL